MDHSDPELAHGLKSLDDLIERTYSKVRLLILPWNLYRIFYRLGYGIVIITTCCNSRCYAASSLVSDSLPSIQMAARLA